MIITLPPQYTERASHEKKKVADFEELSQAFKIAERAAPGFCDSLIHRTVTFITSHTRTKAHTH